MWDLWYKQEGKVSYFPSFSSTAILLAKGISLYCLQDQIAPSTELLFSISETYLTYNSTNTYHISSGEKDTAKTMYNTCLAQSRDHNFIYQA